MLDIGCWSVCSCVASFSLVVDMFQSMSRPAASLYICKASCFSSSSLPLQPSCLELSHAISELLSLKSSPSVAQSVGETCTVVRDSVGKRRKQLQERIEILQTFVSFCSLSQEVSSP